ncbi:MAG: hypothetical protein ACMUEM_03110 [Flavobacteriales bacterium AspAUS03]
MDPYSSTVEYAGWLIREHREVPLVRLYLFPADQAKIEQILNSFGYDGMTQTSWWWMMCLSLKNTVIVSISTIRVTPFTKNHSIDCHL